MSAVEVMLPVTRQPSIVSFMRLRQRRKVDLPQPEGPMKAETARSGMSIERSLMRVLLAVMDVHVLAGIFIGRSA
jgi:hypothetical protein